MALLQLILSAILTGISVYVTWQIQNPALYIVISILGYWFFFINLIAYIESGFNTLRQYKALKKPTTIQKKK